VSVNTSLKTYTTIDAKVNSTRGEGSASVHATNDADTWDEYLLKHNNDNRFAHSFGGVRIHLQSLVEILKKTADSSLSLDANDSKTN